MHSIRQTEKTILKPKNVQGLQKDYINLSIFDCIVKIHQQNESETVKRRMPLIQSDVKT